MKKQVWILAKTGIFTVLFCLFAVILGFPVIVIGSAFANFGTIILIAAVAIITISIYFTLRFNHFAWLMSHI